MNSVLVTDTLFIDKENEAAFEKAGFSVVRLEKLKASEDELILNLKGKVGYVLGGIEKVTDRVIAESEGLKAISFTGSAYKEFIPGWKSALQKNLRLSAAPGANAQSVAEFTIAAALPLLRNIFGLSTKGGPGSYEGREFAAQTAVVIGFGKIGQVSARLLRALGFKVVVASHPSVQSSEYPIVSLDEAIKTADLVTLHVSHPGGDHVLSEARLSSMKNGAVIVNAAFPAAVDVPAAIEAARIGKLRFVFDQAPDKVPDDLPHGAFVTMNSQSAFLTKEAVKRTSDRVTRAMINLLNGQSDPDEVGSKGL